jgi:hypothetical protein
MTPRDEYGLCSVGGCGSAADFCVTVTTQAGVEIEFVPVCGYHAYELRRESRLPDPVQARIDRRVAELAGTVFSGGRP